MVRKLALVAALTAAGLPNWASALGLGDIDLNSYLNQPLEAEIPLRVIHSEELDSLRVSLASRADFARAGIDYQSSLQQLNFRVERDGDTPVIKVTSDGDFREPYVSFLLEVNWSRGRMMREYTLLVDPPVLAGKSGAAVRAPQTQASAPAPSQQAETITTRRSVASEPRGLPQASRSSDRYGPTQRSDTLWSIASEVRPDDSVSVEQTMLAIQRLNPDAFLAENVNQLKAGHVLEIPDRAEIESMTRAQARAEFRRQTEVWRSGGETTVASETAAAPSAAPQGRLQLLAPEAGEGTEARAAGQQPGAAGAGEATGGAAEAGTAEGTSEQSAALRAQVDQLQQQLQDMERLAQLKDDQLAALQAQLQALREQTGEDVAATDLQAADAQAPETPDEATATGEESTTAPAVEAGSEPASEAAESPASTESRFGPPVEATRASADQPQNPYAVEGYRPVDMTTLPSAAVAEPFRADEAPAALAQAQPAAQAPASIGDQISGWWQRSVALFRDNPLYLGIAVAVLLVILLAAMAVRQRRRAAAGFGESILQPSPEPQPAMAAAAAAGAAGAAAAAADQKQEQAPHSEEAESSYLSDFSISGMDSAIESEVSDADPLTEADVFLAYGRYQPAENMIKEAIENEPERLDLKIKLLEIYYAARNGEAFEREAQALHGLVEDHSDPAWQKVTEMGRDLRPDSPLFAEAGVEEGVAGVADSVADDQEFALNENEFDLQEDRAVNAPADDNLIDFDLGELESFGNTEAGAGEAAAVEAESRDASDELAGDLADELSEFAEVVDSDRQPAPAPDAEVADFDLSDLDLEPQAGEDYLAGAASDLDEEEDLADSGLLSDGDEVGTKLDLARAYIDMGDPDGARSILDEVLEEGSEDQKNEAEGLMAQIS